LCPGLAQQVRDPVLTALLACASGVTPWPSASCRSAPAASSRRTISVCAAPPSPRIDGLEQRRPAEPVDVVDVDRVFSSSRTVSTWPWCAAGISAVPP
jgi:hypothetical protein